MRYLNTATMGKASYSLAMLYNQRPVPATSVAGSFARARVCTVMEYICSVDEVKVTTNQQTVFSSL
jgi:hypothetical protein